MFRRRGFTHGKTIRHITNPKKIQAKVQAYLVYVSFTVYANVLYKIYKMASPTFPCKVDVHVLLPCFARLACLSTVAPKCSKAFTAAN